MIEEIWNGILEFTARFVIPDWGAVIALLPVLFLVLVVAFFARVVVRYATAGPKRRRRGRVKPVAPAGIHLPGPTWSPILAGTGTFLVFLGLVFPGPILLLAVAAFALALLVWGAEGLREYDHLDDEPRLIVGQVPREPPPGVHLPGPSFRPILIALAITILFAGMIFGGWVLAAGVILTIITLLGWLNDARKEYRHVVAADTTGHIENEPAPRWPKLVLSVMGILVVGAVALNLGWFPPGPASGGVGEPGASPGASGVPGSPGSSGPPSGPAADVEIVAEQVRFTTTSVTAPADTPFTIAFDNRDQGTPHDVDIQDSSAAKVYDGEIVTGPVVHLYDVSPLAAGTYTFFCSVHPTMTGELTAQ